MISYSTIEDVGLELTRQAAIVIPKDYADGIKAMLETEPNELSKFVLKAMVENWEAAEADRRAMCADTGLPRFYVKAGNEGSCRRSSRWNAASPAWRRRERGARPNRVHPLSRRRHNKHVGIHAPEIDYSFEPDADWVDITTVHKGGLFGTDYRMLFPGDGIDGIKKFYLDVLVQFGRRGLACQPAIIGIGLGGSKDTAMTIGKQAACLRVVGDRNPDPKIAVLEAELKELGNSIGMGPMGFVGKSMVVDCHIEVAHTHTGGMPMSVHAFCLSSRRAVARLYADGRVEYRTDPAWFTDYHRREGVE